MLNISANLDSFHPIWSATCSWVPAGVLGVPDVFPRVGSPLLERSVSPDPDSIDLNSSLGPEQ